MERDAQEILGGRAYVFRRDDSKYWYAAAFLNGQNHRHSTKHLDLEGAIIDAEEWYISTRSKAEAGTLAPEAATEPGELTFAQWGEIFLQEYKTLTEGVRNPRWVQMHEINLRVHINPFMGHVPISKVDSSMGQQYRMHRMTLPTEKNPHSKDTRHFKAKLPARKTLHNEIVTIRLVLKTAERHKAITAVPNLTPPYRAQTKVTHRPWFSLGEYKQLYTATRKYAKTALPHIRWGAEQVHDFVLFMANTGLRPDEAMNLQHRDVEIIHDEDTDETILLIEVRGKQGVGFCKSTANAVKPYLRLKNRPKPQRLNDEMEETGNPNEAKRELPQPQDHVFPSNHIKLFNKLLIRENLKFDREGQARVAYSLRHSYICFRLMERADVFQIAKNCRTSVEIIEDHYAKHIKHLLDAGLINTRRPNKSKTITDDADQDL